MRSPALSCLGVLVLAATAARLPAHELHLEERVVADPGGAFTYGGEVQVGPGHTAVSSTYEISLGNVQAGGIHDGFCLTRFEEGETIPAGGSSFLVDPSLPGLLRLDWFLCTVPTDHIGVVQVLPSGTAIPHATGFPDEVEAAPDGSYSYSGTFTVGPGGAALDGWGFQGVENTSDSGFADRACVARAEGFVLTVTVSGVVDTPTTLALVRNYVQVCGQVWDYEEYTTIRPYAVVPVERTTWGRVKSLFGDDH